MLLGNILTSYDACRSRVKCDIVATSNQELMQHYRNNTHRYIKSIYLHLPNNLRINNADAMIMLETHGLICLPLIVPSKKERYATMQIFGDALVDIHGCLILAVAIHVKATAEIQRSTMNDDDNLNNQTLTPSIPSYLPPPAILGFSTQSQIPVMARLDVHIKTILYSDKYVAPIPKDILRSLDYSLVQ